MGEKHKETLPFPDLIPGPRQGRAWDVRHAPAGKSHMRVNDEGEWLRVPEPVTREDLQVQLHELGHVVQLAQYTDGETLTDKHAQRFQAMLWEITNEAQWLRVGVDIRQARDGLDWLHHRIPTSRTKLALQFLQLTFSADASQNAALQAYYRAVCDQLEQADLDALVAARDGVIADPSLASVDAWAVYLGQVFKRLKADPPEPKPETPAPEGGEPGSEGESGESEPNAPQSDGEGEESPEESEGDSAPEEGGDDGAAGDSTDGTPEPEPGADSDAEPADADDTERDGRDGGTLGDSGDAEPEVSQEFDDDDDGEEPELEPPPDDKVVRRREAKRQEVERAERKAERAERKLEAFNPAAELAAFQHDGQWLEIHRHTTVRNGKPVGQGGWRVSQDGPSVRYPGRLFQDGRVFARSGVSGGGILIDGSGSMQWDQAKVERACKLLPGVWVGWYSWHYSAMSGEMLYRGRLCVVAERGRVGTLDLVSDEEAAHTGGNSCDAEALAYAAQAVVGPLVWVSDSFVCADASGDPKSHHDRCDAIMARRKIVRVATVDEAIDYLSRKPVMGHKRTDPRGYLGWSDPAPEPIRLKL